MVTFLSQNYGGMETLLSQADKMMGLYNSDIAEGMKSAILVMLVWQNSSIITVFTKV